MASPKTCPAATMGCRTAERRAQECRRQTQGLGGLGGVGGAWMWQCEPATDSVAVLRCNSAHNRIGLGPA